MTSVAPEPADHAVTRVRAGALGDPTVQIAVDLAALLNRATAAGATVLMYPGPGDLADPEYRVEGHGDHAVTWDRDTRAWTAT